MKMKRSLGIPIRSHPTRKSPLIRTAACLGTGLALMLVLGTAAAAAPASPAVKRNQTTPVAAMSSPGTAGLVNDWLRLESAEADAWDVGGQLRLRHEVRDNAGAFPNRDFIRDLSNDNNILMERLRYHIGCTPTPWFTAYVEGRNSLEQGDDRSPSPEMDRFNLRQAYLALGDPKQSPVVVKLGRQELLYGDERFVGIGDWSNTGRTFDAAKLHFTAAGFWLDAFAGRVVVPYDGRFDESSDYDLLSGLYASSTSFMPWQETQLYFLARNVGPGAPNSVKTGVPGTPTTARDIYTCGTRWASLPGKLDGWDYSLEVAGQFGSINQANVRRTQQSLAAFAGGGHTWNDCWGKPRLGLGYEFGTGDSNPNDGKNQTFENLFGTNHRFYGAMDLFCERNMHIPRLCASIKPMPDLSLSSECLFFWLADTHDSLYPESGPGRNQNGYGKHPGFDPYAGTEIDLVATYTNKKFGDLQLGYGHFFAGDYIKQSIATVPANGGTVDANWFYLQARLNF